MEPHFGYFPGPAQPVGIDVLGNRQNPQISSPTRGQGVITVIPLLLPQYGGRD